MTRQELQNIAIATGQIEFDIVDEACRDMMAEHGKKFYVSVVMDHMNEYGIVPKFVAITARTMMAFRKK